MHEKYSNFFRKKEEMPIIPQNGIDPNQQVPPPVDILGENNFDQQYGAYPPIVAPNEVPTQRNLYEPSQVVPLPGYDRNPQEFVLSEPPRPTPIQP